MRPRALAIVLLSSACSRPSAPPSPEAAPASPSPPIALPAAPATPSTTESIAAPPPDAGAPKLTPPAPVACASDQDCGWEDPCNPRSCGAPTPPDPVVRCARPKPAGECRCAAGACTLVRSPAARAEHRAACESDAECAFSPRDGKCLSSGGESSASTGVVCACDTLNRRCVQTWRGDVACKSWRDCSWQQSSGKPTVSVPAWLTPRPKPSPVQPCKDGEVDSVCEAGTCRIRAWKC